MPQIAVIIPCYNAASFIARTVSYLQVQTMQDFECFLVDDGSTDNTYQLISDIACSDHRFTALTQHNSGPGPARNSALDHVSAPVIAFMDSDDAILPNHLQLLLNGIEDVDLLFTSALYLNATEPIPTTPAPIPDELLCTKDKNEIAQLIARHPGRVVWAAAFRTDIIRKHHIIFPPYAYEDTFFVYRYLLHVSSLRLTNQRSYCYIRYSNSITSSGRNYPDIQQVDDLANLVNQLTAYLNLNPSLIQATRDFVLSRYRASITKPYHKDTYMPYCVRISRWNAVARNTNYKAAPKDCFHGKEYIFFLLIRTKLFYLFDPLLLVATRVLPPRML